MKQFPRHKKPLLNHNNYFNLMHFMTIQKKYSMNNSLVKLY